MATAAIKNHLIPKALRSNDQNEDPSSNAQGAPRDQSAREQEKRFIVHWEEEQRPLEPDEITEDLNQKRLGQSSSSLRPEDFKFMKTLGTGMKPRPKRRSRRLRSTLRHLRTSMAGETSKAKEHRRRQSLCAQGSAQS